MASLLVEGKQVSTPQDVPLFEVEEGGGDEVAPGQPRAPLRSNRSGGDTDWAAVYVEVVDLGLDDMEDLLLPREGGLLSTDDVKSELTARYELAPDWRSFCPHTQCDDFVRRKLRSPTRRRTTRLDRKFFEEDDVNDVIDEQFAAPAPGRMFSLIQENELVGLFNLLRYRNGSAHDLNLHARSRQRVEDDVDLLMFIVQNSHAPISQCLLFSAHYQSFAQTGTQSVSREKASFFSVLAQRLTQSVPVGRLYELDRATLLGPDAGSPLEIALKTHNIDFTVSGAVQQFVNETWGPNQFASVKGIWLMLRHPLWIFVASFQARRAMWICSQLALVAVLWIVAFDISESTEDKTLGGSEIAMYIFALSNLLSEIGEWASHVVSSRKQTSANPNTVVLSGTIRHFTLNPWNIVDAISSAAFVVMFVLRLSDVLLTPNHSSIVLAFVRLLHMFEMHSVLGPLVRSITRMTGDIVLFVLLFIVFLLAFTVAFTALFRDIPDQDDPSLPGAYSNYQDSMLTLWESSLGDFDYGKHVSDDPNAPNSNFVGTALLTLYITIAHVIMLNLLIALMSSTYEHYRDHSVDEYLFGRARAVLSYARAVSQQALPPPLPLFQLIAWTLWRVAKAAVCCAGCCCGGMNPARRLAARRRLRAWYLRACDIFMVAVYWPPLAVAFAVAFLLTACGVAFLKVFEAIATLVLAPPQVNVGCMQNRVAPTKRSASFSRVTSRKQASVRDMARLLREKAQWFVARPSRPRRVYLVLDTLEGHSHDSTGRAASAFDVDNVSRALRRRVQTYSSGTPPLRLFQEQPELSGKYVMMLSWMRIVRATVDSVKADVMAESGLPPPGVPESGVSPEWRQVLSSVMAPLRILARMGGNPRKQGQRHSNLWEGFQWTPALVTSPNMDADTIYPRTSVLPPNVPDLHPPPGRRASDLPALPNGVDPNAEA